MTDYKGILRLSALGIAKQDIAAACKCSRNTVRNVLNAADKSGLSWDTTKSRSNEQLKTLLFPTAETSPLFKMPDYEYVHREMQKSGVTLSLLWVEYCEKCRQNQEMPYKSTQFNKYYADYVHKTKATMHLEYKPGDTMQVDWAGQTARIIDTDTGEDIDVYIFVSVLAHSGYAYVEGFLDMKQESWITAHVNAYHFYEGVTRILTPDNLKTGIIKNTREGVEVNRSYLEMAEHYGTAVIPARPRSPKDKALVENSVGIISTWILAALRSRQFFTLQELNEVIQEKLYDFNHKSFQKKEGSRATIYEAERVFLLPLPSEPFELATWKIATVPYNYHVSVEQMNYSCPSEYIKQKVDVRITRSTIEVFFAGTRLTSHRRLYGHPGQYSTLEAHMPPDHQMFVQWNGERFLRWAESIGENTVTLVRLFLTTHKVEQQGYKSCMVLLKQADKYSPQRLDAACKKALTFTPMPSLKSVQSILKSGLDKLLDPETTSPPPEIPKYGFTRGADYYRRDEQC